jgi:cell wall-associated NlpC family hydrolase
VSFAESQIGTPYVFGGASPAGYDCSGLVMAAWAKAGVQIPRTTYEQWHTLPHVPTADLEPGDLLFYNEASHVAIYAGNGEIIDAPHAGADVEEIPMSTHRYAASFDGAARP